MTGETIRHMVLFCLKHDKKASETEKFLKDGQAILSAVPNVKNFEVLKQISTKNDYDFGFSMEFSNKKEYDAYSAHPAHCDFVSKRWEKEVSRFSEIDFKGLD